MPADGNWKVTINTPMGAQISNVGIATNGNTFTATVDGGMGTQEVNGTIDGDTLTWSMKVTDPMRMTLEFTAKVDGDRMTGACRLGMFGNASLTGERV